MFIYLNFGFYRDTGGNAGIPGDPPEIAAPGPSKT